MWFVLMGRFTAHEPVFVPKNEIEESDYDNGHYFKTRNEADSWVKEYRADIDQRSYIPW